MLLPVIILAAASVSNPFAAWGKGQKRAQSDNEKVVKQEQRAVVNQIKPLYTQTPKPSITKFRQISNLQGANIPVDFPTDADNSLNLVDEVKQQLTSLPMVIFYVVLSLCVVTAIGIFMFYKDSEDDAGETTQDAVIENQLNQVLDSQLENETMVI